VDVSLVDGSLADRSTVGQSTGGDGHQFLMSTLINESVVIDAGSIGFVSPLDVQRRVRHVFLSHCHMDHIASLPIFLDNIYAPGPDCPTVYGSEEALNTIRRDIFNGRVWPDLVELSTPDSPFLQMETLQSGTTIEVDSLRITPIELQHVVPTMGFIVEDKDSAMALVSDTGPTSEIWQVANRTTNLKAVFLEASFPTHLDWLAEETMHLTPRLLAEELKKLRRPARVIAVHIKAAHREEVDRELRELSIPKLEVGVPNRVYHL
jgi:cAMP phosphodiesterase